MENMNIHEDRQPADSKQAKEKALPLMNAIELGRRYSVSDDQIRNWSKLPGFPPKKRPGRWVVADFDTAVATMKAAGGPRMMHWRAENPASRSMALSAMMTAAHLGGRYHVSEDTIRNWAHYTAFPKQAAPGRWLIEEVDDWVQVMRHLGGPNEIENLAEDLMARGESWSTITLDRLFEASL
jgi:hypothetical protein